MQEDNAYRPQDVRNYPLHMIVSIVQPASLDKLLTALAGAAVTNEHIDVARGDADAERIVEATESGALGRLVQWFAPGEEHVQRSEYVQALRAGDAVVRVIIQDESQKAVIGQLLADHGGHFINYYGRWTVETLAP